MILHKVRESEGCVHLPNKGVEEFEQSSQRVGAQSDPVSETQVVVGAGLSDSRKEGDHNEVPVLLGNSQQIQGHR